MAVKGNIESNPVPYIAVMPPYVESRSPASQTLIRLRDLLQMSQAEFAVKLLNMSPMSVTRMETRSPPRGEMLLRLAGIADDQAELLGDAETVIQLWKVRDSFRALRAIEHVAEIVPIGSPVVLTYERDPTDGGSLTGYLLARFEEELLEAAQLFVATSSLLRLKERRKSRQARQLVHDMLKVAIELVDAEIEDKRKTHFPEGSVLKPQRRKKKESD